jgi:hypothetical protein
MHTVQLIGRLTADPETRTTPNGRSVCRMRIAVPGRTRDQAPVFVDVETWNKTAEALRQAPREGPPRLDPGAPRARPVADRGRPAQAAPLRRCHQRPVPRPPPLRVHVEADEQPELTNA